MFFSGGWRTNKHFSVSERAPILDTHHGKLQYYFLTHVVDHFQLEAVVPKCLAQGHKGPLVDAFSMFLFVTWAFLVTMQLS